MSQIHGLLLLVLLLVAVGAVICYDNRRQLKHPPTSSPESGVPDEPK